MEKKAAGTKKTAQMPGKQDMNVTDPDVVLTGEALSLAGRLPGRMGDRVHKTRPPQLQVKDEETRSKPAASGASSKASQKNHRNKVETHASLEVSYEPQSDATAQVWSVFVSELAKRFNDQPRDVLAAATEEALHILRNVTTNMKTKMGQLREIIGPVDDDQFNQLYQLTTRLSDYTEVHARRESDEDKGGEDEIVAITFDDEDEDGQRAARRDNDDDLDAGVEALRTDVVETDSESIEESDNEDGPTILEDTTRFALSTRKTSNAGDGLATESSWPPPLLKLDNYVFKEGARFMSNRSVTLPKGSERQQRKTHVEVTVPAPTRDAKGVIEARVPIEALPDWARGGFPNVKELNRLQSTVYKAAFQSNSNLLICAPTGAGKTNVAMLTILNALSGYLVKQIPANGSDEEAVWRVKDSSMLKLVYIAPMKSLVTEVVGNLSNRLTDTYGIVVEELTGDVNVSRQRIDAAHVLVCTPEKWDIITRQGTDRGTVRNTKLLIIDEIHLLHDDRGPVLEAIIARTLRTRSELIDTRIVGLSATLPNAGNVAEFMKVHKDDLFIFGPEHRPVPLEQSFIGVNDRSPVKRITIANDICYTKVAEQVLTEQNQVIIFVHSRKDTYKTAKYLISKAAEQTTVGQFAPEESASSRILRSELSSVHSKQLAEIMTFGFGIHHAGLKRDDRHLVESLFADGHLKVLVSTSTLAWGVNLPAHAVIIKGTQVYSPEKGDWTELSPLDLMQMIGRAGRPQYDTTGLGIVITQVEDLQYYLSLLNEQLPIESQLISRLPELLLAEIVSGTVDTTKSGVEWLDYTYLSVRLHRNPRLYGIDADVTSAKLHEMVRRRKEELIHAAATLLEHADLIEYAVSDGTMIATKLGHVASQYYCSVKTMQTYNQLLESYMTDIDVLKCFSLSSEFRNLNVRQEESLEMTRLVERVPVPIREAATDSSAKVNVLLQTYISQLPMQDAYALTADMVYISQSAGRLMRAMYEVCLAKGWAQSAAKCLSYCKMVNRRQWTAKLPLRQMAVVQQKFLTDDMLSRLERKDFPWSSLFELDASQIGDLMRNQKDGKVIHGALKRFPKLNVSANLSPISRSLIKIDITVAPDFIWDDEIHGQALMFWILIEDTNGEEILAYDTFILYKDLVHEEHNVDLFVPLSDPVAPCYYLRVVADQWIGCESVTSLSFRNLSVPSAFSQPTELRAQAKPVAEFESSFPTWTDSLKHRKVTEFTPVQVQVFDAVINGTENVLVSAPSNTGKTLLAELAIINCIKSMVDGKKVPCVYVAGNQDLALAVWEELMDANASIARSESIAIALHKESDDWTKWEKSDLLVTEPVKWEKISRSWRSKQSRLREVPLFVFDDIHMLEDETEVSSFRLPCPSIGAKYEMLMSRMRVISEQVEKPSRIIAMGHSIGPHRDLANWLGVRKSMSFMFHPRDVESAVGAVEVDVRALKGSPFGQRWANVRREAFHLIRKHRQSSQSLAVAVLPDPTAAVDFAETLFDLSESVDLNLELLPARDEKKWPPLQEEALDPRVARAYQCGIMILDAHSSIAQRKVFLRDYNRLAVVIVTTAYLHCLPKSLTAGLVLLLDTVRYDGVSHSYGEYPMTTLLRALAIATAPSGERRPRFVVYCGHQLQAYYSKFLKDPLAMESCLDRNIDDYFNAEIRRRTITNKQDAVDLMTWTYYYRRLLRNPNFYGLAKVSVEDVSRGLTDLVQGSFEVLEEAECITSVVKEEEDDKDTMKEDDGGESVSSLNFGWIADQYNVSVSTIELFGRSLTQESRMRAILEVVCRASEFDSLPIRNTDQVPLSRLAQHTFYPLEAAGKKLLQPHVKVNCLLQAHMIRALAGQSHKTDLDAMTEPLQHDLRCILPIAMRLLHAAVDVLASKAVLKATLAAMDLCKCLVQAVQPKGSLLLQLPYADDTMVAMSKKVGITTIYDLIEAEEDARDALFATWAPKSEPRGRDSVIEDIAEFCNRYPSLDIDVTYDSSKKGVVRAAVRIVKDEDADLGPVLAPRYPKNPLPTGDNGMVERWWIVLADAEMDELYAIKYGTARQLGKIARYAEPSSPHSLAEDEAVLEVVAQLTFPFPADKVAINPTVYVIARDYLGCDQELRRDHKKEGLLKQEDFS
eukprot:Clim_evm7s210 gene=Clim_evmTU7s210